MSLTWSGVFIVNLISTHFIDVSSVDFVEVYVGWNISPQKVLNNVYC